MDNYFVFFAVQFAIAFFNVCVHGLQTQNVVKGLYVKAGFTSLLMSVGQVTTIGLVASNPWDSLIPVSLGGCLGILSAMYIKREHHA